MVSNPPCPHLYLEDGLVFDWSDVDIVGKEDGENWLFEDKLDTLSWAAAGADCDYYNSPNDFDDVAGALNYHWNEIQILKLWWKRCRLMNENFE